MVMKTKIIVALLTAGVLGAGQSALAHHPFAAEYDAEKPVTLTGTLSKMEWVNPHSWIYMDVKTSDRQRPDSGACRRTQLLHRHGRRAE
jgi:hypothetical protein